MTPERFILQQEPGQPQRFIKWVTELGLLEQWERTFSMSFFEFRRQLQALARSNLDSVRNARISTGLAQVNSWINAEEDEFIFPVDDDDWFDPGLGELAAVAPETVIIVWPPAQLIYDPKTGRPLLRRLPSGALLTNNWGIRKSFLRHNFNRNTILRILSRHAEATYEVAVALGARRELLPSRFTAVDIKGGRVELLPLPAGLALKHFGALSILLPALRNGGLLTAFELLDLDSTIHIPRWLAWSEPWIRGYQDLARRCQ